MQGEAGMQRRIEWEMDAVVLGKLAPRVESLPLGVAMRWQGFLALKRQGGRQWVLHLQHLLEATARQAPDRDPVDP